MSSVKRRNENAQIGKEDYEATVESATAKDAGSFERATEATLQQRRIIQLRSPIAPPPADNKHKPQAKVKASAFAGITLQVGALPSRSLANQAVQVPDDELVSKKKSLELWDSFEAQVMNAPLNASWLELMMQYVEYDNELHAKRNRSAVGAPKALPPRAPAPATTSVSLGTAAPAAPAAAANKNADDSTTTLPSTDDEWIEIQSFEPVRMFRNKDPHDSKSGWTQFCAGKLIIQQDRHDASTRRMLMRDSAGIKVHVNISLRGGLVFKRSDSTNPKTNAPVVRILFRATNNDPARGAENFVMRPTSTDADALEQILRELATEETR